MSDPVENVSPRRPIKKLTVEEKGAIYDIMVSTQIWQNFFMFTPTREERGHNIRVLFNDVCKVYDEEMDERENVLHLHKCTNTNLHPTIVDIFSRLVED